MTRKKTLTVIGDAERPAKVGGDASDIPSLADWSRQARDGAGKPGLVCPRCGCKMWVRDTDPVIGGIRRYRECRNCGYRRRTIER